MRAVFFGNSYPYSLRVLDRLIAAGAPIAAVVCPMAGRSPRQRLRRYLAWAEGLLPGGVDGGGRRLVAAMHRRARRAGAHFFAPPSVNDAALLAALERSRL